MLTVTDKGVKLHGPTGIPYQQHYVSLQIQGLVAMKYVDYSQICLNPPQKNKLLQAKLASLLLSTKKEILKKGMT